MIDLPRSQVAVPDCPRCRDMRKVSKDYEQLNLDLIDKNNQLTYAVRELKKKFQLMRKWLAETEVLTDRV